MGQLDASIVTLTYPRLQTEFGATLGSVEWVSLGYLVVLAVLLVPVGRWADARGRKLLYLYGFAVFALASAACALAPSLGWLVAGRGVQAAGAALLQANSVALVVLAVPGPRVRTALGLQAAAQAVGLALGPTLGGVMVQAFGWRSVFWVNVPVGAVAIIAGHYLLPRSRELSPRQKSDVAGFATLAVFVGAGLLALSGLSGMPLSTAVVIGLVALATAAAVLFWRVEGRAAAPLVDTALLGRGGIGAALVGALLAYLLLFAPLVLFPTLFAAWGMSGAGGGLVLSCLPVGFALSAVGANVLGLRGSHGVRVLLGASGAFAALAAGIGLWRSPAAVAVVLLVLGVSLGVAIPANNAAVMAAVPADAAAVTGGMVNVARALGTSLGVAMTAMGVHLAKGHGWDAAPVVLSVLLVCALGLAATTTASPGTHGGSAAG